MTPYDFSPEQWEYVMAMYRSGYEAGESDGWTRGYDRGWWAGSTAWEEKQPPAVSTPYVQVPRPRQERVYEKPAKTAAQIQAEARYSWERHARTLRQKTASAA